MNRKEYSVGILRRIFIASVVVFAFAFTSSAFAINSNTSSRTALTQAATLHVPATSAIPASLRVPLNPASPPYACTAANDGAEWTDPSTGEIWECICFPKEVGGGRVVTVCDWGLLRDQPNPSTWENINSGLMMDVYGASLNGGAPIIQWPYNGGNNQWWKMNVSGCCGGAPELNAVSVNSGQCEGVNGGSTDEGASIIQWPCNNNTDQIWVYAWTGSYFYGWPIWNIVNNRSGMCLGISGGSTQAGAHAIQWSCNGNADQEWY